MKLLQLHLPRLLLIYVLQFVLLLVMDVLWNAQRPVADTLLRALFIGTFTYLALAMVEARRTKNNAS